jgi:hypothetical protein
MSVLDNFPSMEELYERYGQEHGSDRVVPELRDEYDMRPEEYEEAYGAQFSYDLPLIIFTKPRAVSEPINYDVNEYYFSAGLGLGVHKRIGLVVVFHRDARKNFIIPSLLFERYAQAVFCVNNLMESFLKI